MALRQLARILGDELYRCLGLSTGELPPELSPGQLAAVHQLVDQRLESVTQALMVEAAACDDVQDADSALLYLEDRLADLGPFLTKEQQERLRESFRHATAPWGGAIDTP